MGPAMRRQPAAAGAEGGSRAGRPGGVGRPMQNNVDLWRRRRSGRPAGARDKAGLNMADKIAAGAAEKKQSETGQAPGAAAAAGESAAAGAGAEAGGNDLSRSAGSIVAGMAMAGDVSATAAAAAARAQSGAGAADSAAGPAAAKPAAGAGKAPPRDNHSIFGVLRLQTFRNLWGTMLISNLGGMVQGVGAGWLMLSLTSSQSLVGMVQGAMTLPMVIFSIWAGALADNYDRRKILINCMLAIMLVSLLLVALTYGGWITPAILLLFTFLIGCCDAIYNPPWQATVGDLVPREQIPAAVSLNSVGYNLMRSMGPTFGGALVAAFGGIAAFIFNFFTYFPLLAVLIKWKPAYARSTLPRERMMSAMSDGLRYVLMSPNLLHIMGRSFLFGIGAISIFALLPIVARGAQGSFISGALLYGILLGCFGLGAIIGGTYNMKIRARLSSELITALSFLGFALSCFILSFSSNAWVDCLAVFPAGICWVLALTLFNANVQLSTPRWVVSRALAFYQTCSYAGMAAGSWLWGALGDAYGTKAALFICGVWLVIGACAGLRFRIYDIGATNLSPTDPMREPELRLALQARSGPIMIMLEYQIAQKNTERFLRAMRARRRIRLRDGARAWTLLRDLEQPERWVETYHMPTWVDYLRHNQRSTKDDMRVIAVLDRLNEGKAPPHVRRMIERQTVPQADELRLKPPPKAV